MVSEFEEGEVYRNEALDYDIMILGIRSTFNTYNTYSILKIDRETQESMSPDTIKIHDLELNAWEKVKYVEDSRADKRVDETTKKS